MSTAVFQVRGADCTIDEEVDEDNEKMFESENLQETRKEDLTADKEDSTEDKEKTEEEETTSEEQIIERGRKRLKSPL